MGFKQQPMRILSGFAGFWRGKSKSVLYSLVLIVLALSAIPFHSLADNNQESGVKLEFEHAKVVNADGKNIAGSRVADSYASGGFYMGSTGDKGFIFTDVPLSNRLSIGYAGTFTSYLTIYLKVGEEFEEIGQIGYSTTQGWNMDNRWTASSDMINIPEGSTVKLVPARDVNLDYALFSADPWYQESDLEADTILGKNASLENASVIPDVLAYVGSAAELPSGGSLSVSVPEGLSQEKLNVVNVRYRAQQEATVSLLVNGEETSMVLPATHGVYTTTGITVAEYQAGASIRLTLRSSGPVALDYIHFSYMAPSETVYVPKTVNDGGRTEISLNGIWSCDSSDFAKYADLENTVPDSLSFDNSVSVPGMWDMAAVSMGNFNWKAMWYKRVVHLDAAPQGQVILKIDRAYYGRYIYVNGQLVDEYQYNYTNSYTNITEYLRQGDNDIVIMLGGLKQQIQEKSSVAHVGSDGERIYFYPGIVDRVSLIFTGDGYVTASQTAPNLEDGSLTARTTFQNDSAFPLTMDVTYRIYELGVFRNGVAQQEKKLVATVTQTGVTMAADGKTVVDSPVISLEHFGKDKYWTPKNPFLYQIEISTESGVFSSRFGMRTFYFDQETKLPMLNGEVHYLRGTNVAMNRFYDDPDRGQYPWMEDWARSLYQEYKSVNWDCLRFHLGSAPSLWYDVADEEGFLIMDEYAWWECQCGCTVETLVPEMHAWIDEKANHPSVILWDMQNEVLNSRVTSETIRAVRDYDIQNRPWDNGWSEPQSETDTFECHPYLHDPTFLPKALNNITTSYENPTSYIPESLGPNNPKINNEYSNMWLNRYGDPASTGIKAYYDKAVPGGTAEDRIAHYAVIFGQISEFWRSGRHFAGLLHFGGLVYSKPMDQGATGDILMPDLSDPTIHPAIKESFRNAFAPLGVILVNWTDECELGETREIPLTLVNDLNWDIDSIKVVIRLYADDTLVSVQSKRISLKAAGDPDGGDLVTENLTIDIPSYEASEYRLVAQYMRNDQLVSSTRTWQVTGGSANGSPVAVQDETEENYIDDDYPSDEPVKPGDQGEDEFPWMTILIVAEVLAAAGLIAFIGVLIWKKRKQ